MGEDAQRIPGPAVLAGNRNGNGNGNGQGDQARGGDLVVQGPALLGRVGDPGGEVRLGRFVVSLVRLLALPDSPLAIRDARLMLGTAGAVVALLLAALMYAPTGRASGGHFNPGVTVFLWADGLFPGRAVLPYVAAQLAGSVSGPALARLVWGDPVLRIHYALVAPAPGTGTTALFLIETAALIAVLAAVAVVMGRPRLHALIPAVIAVGVGLVIASLGAVTGANINPARAFGPALLSGEYTHLGTNLLSPPRRRSPHRPGPPHPAHRPTGPRPAGDHLTTPPPSPWSSSCPPPAA
ncbi:aquaporin [Streptomyces sp. Ag109_G2-15]|uniref:aquaporin n=1 Tax=Streptomyces sp. Ag109_G2-15 TaxID=1938850 RepID=UPI000BD926F8|nr:aquaporin [Streptomyces sp. Ag109_G2-15]SOE06800.1 Major intrinsic protein [Streptomyces sp. Ag109_G2-15]